MYFGLFGVGVDAPWLLWFLATKFTDSRLDAGIDLILCGCGETDSRVCAVLRYLIAQRVGAPCTGRAQAMCLSGCSRLCSSVWGATAASVDPVQLPV